MRLLWLLFALALTEPALGQNTPSIVPPYPPIGISASSGNVAAATATATLPATQRGFTWLCGYLITSSGATAAAVVSGTVTGLNGGTQTFTYTSVAGATLGNPPLMVPVTPCQPSSAVNTAISVSLPSLGAGNTNTTVSAWGMQ